MNTLPMREVTLLMTLTAMSSFAENPGAIIEVAEQLIELADAHQSLDETYVLGLSLSECIRLVSTSALLIYITERVVRLLTPAVKFIAGLFKKKVDEKV